MKPGDWLDVKSTEMPYVKVFGNRERQIVIKPSKFSGLKIEWAIYSLDEQKRLVNQREIVVPLPNATDESAKILLKDPVLYNNRYYLFFESGRMLYATVMDLDGNIDPTSAIVLDTITNSALMQSGSNAGFYNVTVSPDSSRIAIYHEDAAGSEKGFGIRAKVFDTALRTQYSTVFRFPNYASHSIYDVRVANNGTLMGLASDGLPSIDITKKFDWFLQVYNPTTKAVTGTVITKPEQVKHYNSAFLDYDDKNNWYVLANGGASSHLNDWIYVAAVNAEKAAFDFVIQKDIRKDFSTQPVLDKVKDISLSDIERLPNGDIFVMGNFFEDTYGIALKSDGTPTKSIHWVATMGIFSKEHIGNKLYLLHNARTNSVLDEAELKKVGNRLGGMVSILDLTDLSMKTTWVTDEPVDKATYQAFLAPHTSTRLAAGTYLVKLFVPGGKMQLGTLVIPIQ